MSAVPPWRRRGPRSAGARGAAAAAVLAGFGALFFAFSAVFVDPLADERRSAELASQRAAALTAAAEARRREAAAPSADPSALATAEDWLARRAPRRPAEDAALDLLSALRLTAAATNVELASAALIDGGGARRGGDLFAAADMAGLTATTAEARIVADHAGIARFLGVLEAAEPAIRAAAVEIAARTAAAAAEDRRLTARVVVGALSRAPED
ncbi:MAG: hypothetical protein AAF322_08180 [Pseudomonadota bacterium]